MNISCKIHNGKVLEHFGFKWKVWTSPLTEASAWDSAPHARSKTHDGCERLHYLGSVNFNNKYI